MFGPALNTVFASRWRALWFGASMLLLAYCSIPSAEEPGNAADPANADSARAAIAAAGLSTDEAAQLQATVDNLENITR